MADLLGQAAVDLVRRLCVPPEPMTGTEWARRFRFLPETSTAPGAFDPDVVPYARRPLDLMCDPSVSQVVLCWASQMTKSTLIENTIGYRIHRFPAPMVVVQPKIDAAESWSKERFVPMVVATPVLRERVRMGRSTDSTLRYKRFPGGFLFCASAQSASELASRSAPFVLCDEVDRFEAIPGEGNPVEIVARRQGAADLGLLVLTSTPRDAETTIIWPYLENGTYELYHVPCPHCDQLQPLVWSALQWTPGKPRTACYACQSCGAVIEERSKRDMLHAGDWVMQNPEAEGYSYSFHLNALYSPFSKSSWATLAAEWERAQGKPSDLQVFINTRLAELWTETSEAAEPEGLLGRLEEGLEEGVVPDGVGALTAGVDVQANRLEAYVWGWGAGLESWLIAHALIEADPQREPDQAGSAWDRLDKFLSQSFHHAVSGRRVRISCTLIDSGFATSQVYRYTRNRRGANIFASKGQGGEGNKLIGKPSLQGRDRVILYSVGVDEAKREFLRSQILERNPGPGYVHLPSWMTTDQCSQLVAEKRVRRVHRGRVSYGWVKKQQDTPNEALDCRILARAALEQLGGVTISRLSAWAEQLSAVGVAPQAPADEGPAGVEAVVPFQKRPRYGDRGGGFVNAWRR